MSEDIIIIVIVMVMVMIIAMIIVMIIVIVMIIIMIIIVVVVPQSSSMGKLMALYKEHKRSKLTECPGCYCEDDLLFSH